MKFILAGLFYFLGLQNICADTKDCREVFWIPPSLNSAQFSKAKNAPQVLINLAEVGSQGAGLVLGIITENPLAVFSCGAGLCVSLHKLATGLVQIREDGSKSKPDIKDSKENSEYSPQKMMAPFMEIWLKELNLQSKQEFQQLWDSSNQKQKLNLVNGLRKATDLFPLSFYAAPGSSAEVRLDIQNRASTEQPRVEFYSILKQLGFHKNSYQKKVQNFSDGWNKASVEQKNNDLMLLIPALLE